MTYPLYAAIVPTYIQMLDTLTHLLGKAQAHCEVHGVPHEALIEARLTDDMHPFSYQVKSVILHSIGAIEGVRRGSFFPDRSPPPATFADMRGQVTDARAAMAAIDPAEVESFIGRDMKFVINDRVVPYRAEEFLLSFSQPDFYFHLTIAYAILRAQGVSIGKIDFMGKTRKLEAA